MVVAAVVAVVTARFAAVAFPVATVVAPLAAIFAPFTAVMVATTVVVVGEGRGDGAQRQYRGHGAGHESMDVHGRPLLGGW